MYDHFLWLAKVNTIYSLQMPYIGMATVILELYFHKHKWGSLPYLMKRSLTFNLLRPFLMKLSFQMIQINQLSDPCHGVKPRPSPGCELSTRP